MTPSLCSGAGLDADAHRPHGTALGVGVFAICAQGSIHIVAARKQWHSDKYKLSWGQLAGYKNMRE
jgi:hypothetical protein